MSCLVNPRSGYEVDFPVPAPAFAGLRGQRGNANAPAGAGAYRGDRRRAGGAGGGAGARDARRRGPPLRGAGGAGRSVPLGADGPRQGGLRGDDLLLRVRAAAPRRPPSPRPRAWRGRRRPHRRFGRRRPRHRRPPPRRRHPRLLPPPRRRLRDRLRGRASATRESVAIVGARRHRRRPRAPADARTRRRRRLLRALPGRSAPRVCEASVPHRGEVSTPRAKA